MSTGSTSTEEIEDLEKGDIDVHEAQAGDQSLERWLVPDGLEIGIDSLEVVESPGVKPWNHDQKQADFKGEYGETDGEKTALPTPWRCGRNPLDRRLAFR